MQVIGVDVGRNQVKAVTSHGKVVFKSAVGEWRNRKISSGGDYDVEINGEKHFVSDLAIDESRCKIENVSESKIHEETKILFLTALGLLTIPRENLIIVTGLPINQHTPETKKQLLDLVSGDYSVTVNERRTSFTIKNVLVAPEGAATYRELTLDNFGHFVNPINNKTRIVDIGSRTINISVVNEQGKYIDRDSGTLNYGLLDLYNEENLTSNSHMMFLKKIAGDISRKWMDYSNKDNLLFTGGGSIALSKWIPEKFPSAKIVDDAIFSNAMGFYKMGVSQWERLQVAK